MRRLRAIVLSVSALFAATLAGGAAAQEIAATPIAWDEAESPTDAETWTHAVPQPLVQRAPKPGEPTPFATDVRVLASRTHVYVRVDCADPQPERAIAHGVVFDADQSYDDHVSIVLDTFGRHRTAFQFDVNTAGVRSDGLISPAAILTDYDWNGDWRAAVRRRADGWTAFIAIDVRSLRFPRQTAAWRMNIARYVPREQLTLQWSGISLDAAVTDLSRTGVLSNLQSLQPATGWQFSPYVLAQDSNVGRGGAQVGFDVRYQLGPEMAAVVTVNPDFAEAEVDARQINLTPYELFKPEKRAFFLDGANQFAFASGISSIFIPFYSRTIGLVDGLPVRIDAGTKVIGQSGPWSFAALGVRAGDSPVSDPANLFVGRVAYDVDEHLRIGTLVTDGDPSGRTHNVFEGADAIWRTATLMGDKNLNVSAWAARSSGDATRGQHNGFGTYIDYPNDLWRWVISANQFGDALYPALGFLPRPGTRQYDFYLGHFPRPQDDPWRWVHQFFYEFEWEQTDDLHGHTESRTVTLTPFNILTDSGIHLEAHWAPRYEQLVEPFAITDRVTLPIGEYHFDRFHFQAETPTAGAWQAGAQLELGGFYDGTLTQAIPYLRWTSHDGRWHVQFDNETDRVRLREGRFTQQLHQLRASHAIDADMALSTFLQYDTASRRFGANAQWRWIIAPGREAYVILNHNVDLSVSQATESRPPQDNSLTVKLAWNFYL